MLTFTITFNFFGLSYRLHSVYKELGVMQKMKAAADKIGSKLEQAILDPEFFDFYDDDKVSHISFLPHHYVFGIAPDDSSFIEIKLNGIKKRKIYVQEILNQETLFPVYRHTISNSITNTDFCLRVVKMEIGRSASFTVNSIQPFSFDNLEFHFTLIEDKNETYTLLEYLTYENKKLKSNKCETLVRSSYGVVID
jgi:hypothetical protein